MKIQTCRGQNKQNLLISNPKLELNNINAHIKFDENPLILTQVIVQKRKTDGADAWTDVQQMDNQSDTIIPYHYHVVGYKNSIERKT